MVSNRKITISIIVGSNEIDGYTCKATKLLTAELNKRQHLDFNLIRPENFNLLFPGEPGDNSDADKIQEIVETSTGVVLVTPEYHGSFSAVIKLIIENLGYPSKLAGKPVSLLGVAGGSIGAIKSLEQLRSVCSHVGSIVLPGPVSIANVQDYFDDDGNCTDERIENRIKKLAQDLIVFIEDHILPKAALEEFVRTKKN